MGTQWRQGRAPWRSRAGAVAVALATTVMSAGVLPAIPTGPTQPAAAQTAAVGTNDVASVTLRLLARHDLASPGLDGALRPRGNNGDVAVLRDTAYVGGGAVSHEAQSTAGHICTDWGGVKVVDLADPSRPVLRTTIPMVDDVGVGAGPVGNPRFGVRVNNVSVSASAVDARTVATSSFSGDVLAVAVQRCEPPFTTGGRVEFYDVNDPGAPRRLGTYAAASGWGIYEDVRMFTRPNGPGGATRLYALVTLPFNGADVRVVDLNDLRNPRELGAYPSGGDIDRDSVNGCTPAVAARTAAPTSDGAKALVSLSDGTTSLEPHPGAVVNLDLDNLPKVIPGSDPPRMSPSPPHIGYPPDPQVEGNAADVLPFTDAAGRLHALVSEDDLDPALTNVTLDGAGFTDFDGRACEARVGRKLYELPTQRLKAPVVYEGPACGPTSLANATTLAADAPLADPRGAIAVVDPASGCSPQERLDYLQSLGAVGVLQTNTFLDTTDAAPEGGYPAIPNLVAPTAVARAVQYAPANVTGTLFPSSWVRTTTSTVVTMAAGATSGTTVLFVRPLTSALPVGTEVVFPGNQGKVLSALAPIGATALSVVPAAGALSNRAVGNVTDVTVRAVSVAVVAASNTTPVTITTAPHGLATGNRVVLTEVGGNTGANGTWTVTVSSPTTFTLDGSSGTGEYTGSGYVVFCSPLDPNCRATPTRTDRFRFQSLANSTDPVARGQVAQPNRFTVVPGRAYMAGATLEVQRLLSGSFRAAVIWYDAVETPIVESEIANLGSITGPSRFIQPVTAPPGAVRAGLKYEWIGPADGLAYAQYLTFSPSGQSATLRDDRGEWGAQRVVNFSVDPPEELATYRSPASALWPPPDNGIYAPRMAKLFGRDLAFTTWMSDGLRVLDVSKPDTPREVGSFVPPAVADPSPNAGAGPTNRRGETGMLRRGQSWPTRPLVNSVDVIRKGERSGIVVVSDVNAGIYVLEFGVTLDGYWTAASDGGVFAFGAARFLGSMGGKKLNSAVVGMASSPTGAGYWLVATDGGVFTFGDATFAGSAGAIKLAKPVVAMAPTPTGKGYWLVAADGGVFAFGDAKFFGSTGGTRLNQPVVAMSPTPTGKGYWLVAADGGVFAFGDAKFRGSTGAIRLNKPMLAVASTPTGNGYWMTGSDGGVFAFGDAAFMGSTGAIKLNSPMVGLAASGSGKGYRLVAGDGGVFAFGDATFLGSTGAIRLDAPVVGIAALPH